MFFTQPVWDPHPPLYPIIAGLQWWHGSVVEGIQSCPASSVSQHCCMFPCALALSRGNLIPIFTGIHTCAHTQRNRKYRHD